MYSLASLSNARNTLTRELHEHGRLIDLTSDPRYIGSRKVFDDASKELKTVGKAAVKSFPEIKHSGKKNNIKIPKK